MSTKNPNIIDVIKDIPARMKANASLRKAQGNAKVIDMVRNNIGQMDKGDESDPLFRARVMNNNMKYENEYASRMSKKPKRF